MSACLMVGAVALSLSAPAFTLSWTHSVERVEWRESWRIEAAGLRLERAAIKGSGAGMEPAEGAVLAEGWWVWSPDIQVPEVLLAASGATGAGWQLCDGRSCHTLGATAQSPLRLAPCPP